MKEAIELAQLALQTLKAQQQYFSTRDRNDLIRSKELESKLRKKAEGILMMPLKFE